ncbi:NUDIX hydrolase [Limisalsivibrio acetivorans]|uniref:NUDIX hydrolase n=1 Tax=Limisalsivibrio acetivorans TaxID=1304888 RepID=UPI0003B61739|nr:NUDIX hydrolase [Limisalsivibrio acetivorans]
MRERWKLLGIEEKFSDRVLSVEHRRYHFDGAGDSMPFSVVRMKDWVIVVPVTEEGKLVLVRQYRVGTDEVTLEFPGGAVNMGEDPAEGAPRELEEETGYISGRLSRLGSVKPNPAFLTNDCHAYLAEGCEAKGMMQPDPFEDVEPVELSLDEVKELARNGGINHSITLGALAIYLSTL